jgi:hypothetical protein
MKMLCPLTDWKEEKITRGRFAGDTTRFRYVVALDQWNWCIASQVNEKGNIVGESFYGNMKTLLPNAQVIAGKGFIAFVKELTKILGKKSKVPLNIDLNQKPYDIGKELDDILETSYLKEWPPTVYERFS